MSDDGRIDHALRHAASAASRPDALAVRNGVAFVAVGSDDATCMALAGTDTRVVDLQRPPRACPA